VCPERGGAVIVEVEFPCGPARLREIDAMHPPFAAKLEFVSAVDPVHCSHQMMRVLTLPQDAEGLCADVGAILRRPIVGKDNVWDLRESRTEHVGGQAE